MVIFLLSLLALILFLPAILRLWWKIPGASPRAFMANGLGVMGLCLAAAKHIKDGSLSDYIMGDAIPLAVQQAPQIPIFTDMENQLAFYGQGVIWVNSGLLTIAIVIYLCLLSAGVLTDWKAYQIWKNNQVNKPN